MEMGSLVTSNTLFQPKMLQRLPYLQQIWFYHLNEDILDL